MRNIEIKNEIDEIKKWEEKIIRKDLKHKTNEYTYDFQQFKAISFFGDNIYTGKVNISEAKVDQSNLLESIVKLDNKSRPRLKEDKEKRYTYKTACDLYEGRELTLNCFKSGIFRIKEKQGKGIENINC